jgi:hypothetical protein
MNLSDNYCYRTYGPASNVETWETAPFLYDMIFFNYYWMYKPEAKEVMHAIFNQVTPFPLELTELIIEHLENANYRDRDRSLMIVSRREQMLTELKMFARYVVGVKKLKWHAYFSHGRMDALKLTLDPATWLSSFAYESLPYEFGLGSFITGLILQHPILREFLADVGIKRIAASDVHGDEVVAEFAGVIKDYVRVLASELFRRYSRNLLEDLEPFNEIYCFGFI